MAAKEWKAFFTRNEFVLGGCGNCRKRRCTEPDAALAGRGLCSVGLGGLVGGSGRNGCGQGREGQELVGNNSGNNSGGLVAGGSGGG